MNKRTIWILSLVAIVLFIVGFVVLVGASASAAASCQNSTDPNCLNSAAGGAGIGVLIIVLGSISSFVAWIMGLVKTAQLGRWGWFVGVLLLSPLGSLIYGLAGPTERTA